VEVHLRPCRGLEEVGEARERREVGRPRGGEAEEPAVLDQESVVLADPVLEALDLERAVADPAHERVVVLGAPDGVSQRAERVGEAGPHGAEGQGALRLDGRPRRLSAVRASPQWARNVVTNSCSRALPAASGASARATASAVWYPSDRDATARR